MSRLMSVAYTPPPTASWGYVLLVVGILTLVIVGMMLADRRRG